MDTIVNSGFNPLKSAFGGVCVDYFKNNVEKIPSYEKLYTSQNMKFQM